MVEGQPPGGGRRMSRNVAVEHRGVAARLRSFFNPSLWLSAWEALVVASIVPTILLVVFQVAFDAEIVWQWVVIYSADALFIASIVARFLTGYMKRGVLVTDRKMVVLNYLKRSFFVDLFTVVPLEIFAFAATGSREEVLVVAAYLRLNRCVRCYRVWTFITSKGNELGTNTNLWTTLKFSYLAVLSIHVITCVWFAISCQNQVTFNSGDLCYRNSWAQHPNITWENSSVNKRYIVSLYWAVTTITSVGYGDILPTLSAEKWVSVVSMLWGVVLFGYILGGLASTLTTSDAQRARYIHRLHVIKNHLEDAGVSSKVKKKVISYYEYLWQRSKGNPGTDLFDELPVAFQAELSLETYKNVIKKSALFQNAPEEFMRMLSLVAEQQLFLPSQIIISKGDVGQHMYIITRGQAEVISGDGEVVAVMKEGSLFGEVNLVHDIPCGVTMRAKTHCDLLLLSKENVIQIMQHFPEMSTKMKNEIQRRCNQAFSSGSQDPVSDDEGADSDGLIRQPSSSVPLTLWKRLRQWWDTHPVVPGTKFSVVWDLLLATVVILICLVYSFEAGFSLYHHNVAYCSGAAGTILFAFTYLLDLVLVIDIVVSMKTAVRTPTGILTNPKVILKHYLFSLYFLLDVAAVLPLEVFGLAWDTDERYGYVAVFKLNRLIKIWKVMSFFNQMEGSLYISVAYARALKFTFYILTVTHIGACIWFPLGCYSQNTCSSSSWATAHGIPSSSSPSAIHDYIISLYWASATLTSVGYGDVSAHNVQEMVFALVIQLIGIMLYGYCLGIIAATLTNAASFRISFEEKMYVVHQFMFENKLGKGLLQRVDHYFTLLWDQFRGETVPGGQDLMHDMPVTVRLDVSMEECSSLLSKAPFFQHVDTSFLRQLSNLTSTFLFAPGDIILYSGDMGREMYFISKGYVEVLCEDLSQVVAVQGPGGFFGELGFLFGTPRTLTVRAATNCKVVMLENHDLQRILPQYPLLAKEFEALYQDREHVRIAHKAAQEASQRAMNNPRKFCKPSILSALATAMVPSLSVAIRAPMANTIAACVGSKDIQSLVACPCTIGEPITRSLVKFNHRKMQEALRSDAEMGGGGGTEQTLRQRRNIGQVGPSPSDTATARAGGEERREEEREQHSRAYRGTMDNILSYMLLPYTLNPNTRAGRIWELLGVLMAVVSVVSVSMQAAFLHGQGWLWAINYTVELYFIADMIVKLHTAHYNKEGVLITQPLECAKHYFKTNFFMDLLSCLPTDILVLMSWTRDIKDVLRVLSMSRLNRILRIYKLPLAFNYLESQVGRPVGTITEVKLALYMFIATHLMACGWFILACSSMTASAGDPHTCGVDSWAMKMSMLDGSNRTLSTYSISYQYLVSMYWATATSTTVGYGDISAHNGIERVYAVLVMVLGVLAYGYIIASVAASLANADSARAQYQEKLKGIKSFMDDHSLDSALQRRVINYYEYNWQRNKGVSFSTLFQGMPISLQADISLSLYKGIIDQVPLFQNTEIGFTKLLALSIQPRLFLSKEYIVKKGDIGSEMFFINRGMVEVVSEDGSVVFATMTEGKFFGEISLVFSCPRTASIRAATNCDVFVLTKANLDRALSYYPEIAEQIREVAGNRANLVKKRSQIAAKAAAEGKSAADAAKAAAQGTKDETEKEDDSEKPETSATPPSQQPPPPAQEEKKAEADDKKEEEVVVEEMEIEEPSEPPRPSALSRVMTHIQEEVWPKSRWLFTFKIDRDGPVGIFLRLFGCLMAFLSCFTITYQAAFQNNNVLLWIANYIFELYFLIEIFLKFHLTYKDSNGQTVRDLKSIVVHYMKDPMGFMFDLVAILPYEILAAPVPDAHIRTSVVLYLRLPHVIRGVRIQSFISEEEKRLNQKTLLLRLVKFTVLISVCTHFVACLWYILGCRASTCHSGTWAGTAELLDPSVSDADHYLNSLYWSMATMTTTGYGDLSATNVWEMIYAMAVMVAGKLIFGFILGSIASTLANLDTQRVLFEEKLSALKGYMKQQKLPSTVQGRVLNFFDYLWVRNKGTDPQVLLEDMPYCMQSEVSLATTETLIKKVPLFASVSDAFLRHLTLKIRPSIFLPGEFIVHKGDVGLGMFFLYHGQAEVVDEDMIVKEELPEGSNYGDKSLIYNTPVESSVVAVTHVDVFSINQKDFEQVLQDHPNTRASIAELAEQLYGQAIAMPHD